MHAELAIAPLHTRDARYDLHERCSVEDGLRVSEYNELGDVEQILFSIIPCLKRLFEAIASERDNKQMHVAMREGHLVAAYNDRQ